MINGANFNYQINDNNYVGNVSNNNNNVNNQENDNSVFTNSAQFKADTAQLQQDKQEITALIQHAQSGDQEAINELMSLKPQPMNSNNDSNAKLQNEITQMLIQAQAMYGDQTSTQGASLDIQV